MNRRYDAFSTLTFEEPAPGVLGIVLDALVGLEFIGFGGPEVHEGLAAHLEKRTPRFVEKHAPAHPVAGE